MLDKISHFIWVNITSKIDWVDVIAWCCGIFFVLFLLGGLVVAGIESYKNTIPILIIPNELIEYSDSQRYVLIEVTFKEYADYESYITNGGIFGTDSRDYLYYETEEGVTIKTKEPCPHLVGKKVLIKGIVDSHLVVHLINVVEFK